MNTLSQTSQPALTVRGSRFAMPAFILTVIAILVTLVWCAQNPFFSFGSFMMPFVVPLAGLTRLCVMTRATFFDDYCQTQRTSIAYRDIVRVERGRFLLTILYRRSDDVHGAKLRRARLPWIEMRPDDQQKCLDILRKNLPATTASSL